MDDTGTKLKFIDQGYRTRMKITEHDKFAKLIPLTGKDNHVLLETVSGKDEEKCTVNIFVISGFWLLVNRLSACMFELNTTPQLFFICDKVTCDLWV